MNYIETGKISMLTSHFVIVFFFQLLKQMDSVGDIIWGRINLRAGLSETGLNLA